MGYYRVSLGVFPVLFIVFVLGLPCLAQAQEDKKTACRCESIFDNGTVDWTTGSVRAMGKASPPANDTTASPDAVVGAAKADASRKLIAVLKTLATSIEKSHDQDSTVRENLLAGIEKTAMDARIVDQNYSSDCSMEVILETSIFGGFLQLVLPDEIGEIKPIETIKPGKEGAGKGPPLLADLPYTGLILDARGIDYEPVIYPLIVSELGDPIYGAMYISREYAVHSGVCRYVCCMDKAMMVEMVGDNPMIIKGLRKGGDNNTAIVINRSDAEKIEKATGFHSFMRQCKVVIVLD